MASRKEQKEALRREREERERAAREAARRKQLMGYGVGAALAVAAIAIVAVLVLGGGGNDDSEANPDLYPSGVEIPDPGPLSTDVERAAEAAGCELESNPAPSRDHLSDLNASGEYEQNPPNSGNHFAEPAGDGIYNEQPPETTLVHTLEHGRVVIWFKRNLPSNARGELKTLFDEDPYQLVLTPNETKMPDAVAATAWNGDPAPLGTGRTLGCPRWNDRVIDALRAFRDEHRGRGPEPVP